MVDGGSGQVVGPERSDVPLRKASDAPKVDVQLTAFVNAARDSLRARGVGDGRKGRALSARVDPALRANDNETSSPREFSLEGAEG